MIIAAAAITVLAGMAWEQGLSSAVLWQRWTVLIGLALLGVWLGHRGAHLPDHHGCRRQQRAVHRAAGRAGHHRRAVGAACGDRLADPR